MTRYRALVEYDGTDFLGYQRQRAGTRTVQGELERILSQLARQPVIITGAGRTDTGVHALGQVISFTIEWRHDAQALQRALNANLPDDIAVRNVRQADEAFHPRFDARRRTYVYYVYSAEVCSPIRRLHSWHVRTPVNLLLMNRAAAVLVGVHDFATFGMPPQGVSTIREVFAAGWQAQDGFLVFQIAANAFLYRMVRSLVGSLVMVGIGAWQVDDFLKAFEACDRNRSAAAAPPQGLYLASISYGE
jgi:tRNA pseudouridine38-40 synthase